MLDSPSPRTFDLSPLQLMASALAAASAAVTASYFGVNGTVMGAAIASVVATVGSAVYSHSIQRTYDGVRRVRKVAGPRRAQRTQRPIRWSAVAGATSLVFGGATLAVTAGELAAHRPLASVVTGQPDRATTSIGSIIDDHVKPAKPPARPTPAASPFAVQPSPRTSITVPPTSPAPTTAPDTTPSPAATLGPAASTPAVNLRPVGDTPGGIHRCAG